MSISFDFENLLKVNTRFLIALRKNTHWVNVFGEEKMKTLNKFMHIFKIKNSIFVRFYCHLDHNLYSNKKLHFTV